ncbi:uncharacterized protein CDAR_2921 [Caerostris darwini]|uniref:Uncharacterized protein n=1 Tax=Caerostris darwini TaxID=1538125 RepID=A0AAV4TIK0_9ARAC|nr:uncharacterized protein CDAR_2921 [Caerostris darwini]
MGRIGSIVFQLALEVVNLVRAACALLAWALIGKEFLCLPVTEGLFFMPDSGSMRGADLARLQDSISKIIAHFAQPHSTFIYAAYIALLKDNEFDPNTVIQKLLEGDKDARTLGVTPRIQPTIPSPPPSSFISSSPAATQSFLSATPFHPSLSCYSPYNYTLPYHPSGFPLTSASAAAHPALETSGPAVYSSFHPYFPTPPYSSSSAVVPLQAEGAAHYTPPPHRLGDGHTSGDSRGSADLKDESDKEGGGRGETSTPRSVVVSPEGDGGQRVVKEGSLFFPDEYGESNDSNLAAECGLQSTEILRQQRVCRIMCTS